MITSFDVLGKNHLPNIEIYGTEGTLRVPDPNFFDGPVLLNRVGETDWQEMPLPFGYAENSRGLGLADMAAAIQCGRPHRANAEIAFHVLDIMHAIHDASSEEKHVWPNSCMSRPEPLQEKLAFGEIGA